VLVISRCKSDTITESVGLHQSADLVTSTKNGNKQRVQSSKMSQKSRRKNVLI